MLAALCVTFLVTGELACSAPVPLQLADPMVEAQSQRTFASGDRFVDVDPGRTTSRLFLIRQDDPRWLEALRAGRPRTGT
jgi:hypothetical protein